MKEILFIYLIRCSANGRVYIGRTRDPFIRWQQHINALRSNRHHICLMQHDFNKYGENEFAFTVLERVDFHTRHREKEFMQFFDSFNPNKGYNYLDSYIGDKRKHEEKISDLAEKYGINRELLEKPTTKAKEKNR